MTSLQSALVGRGGHFCQARCANTCGSYLRGRRTTGNNDTAVQRESSSDVDCTQIHLHGYLAAVYPTAAGRLRRLAAEEANDLFDSLHFYYDFGCSSVNQSCKEPGVLLRWLFEGLLPCSSRARGSERPSLGSCMAAHFRFDPAWARQAVADGWAEVEHRAFGFGVRVEGLPAVPAGGQPRDASDFLDAGAASMWYVFRRGSGIFYRLGRTLLAPGKTAMVAMLLMELAAHAYLAERWPPIARRSGLFVQSAPSGGALADAQRILSVAKGAAHCGEVGIQPCRCRYILHDAWDDAMIWMARVLGYDTLFITATLLCNQPGPAPVTGNGTSTTARSFATAYPEIVDVRPLTPAMATDQAQGIHEYLAGAAGGGNSSGNGSNGPKIDVRRLRKVPAVADMWVRQMRSEPRLALRDPFGGKRLPPSSRLRPCNFSVVRATLECEDHISSWWHHAAWHRCGVPTCGFRSGGGWV